MRFAFDVMASGKQFCNRKDVTGLVSLLHSEKARVKDTTNTLMGIMDPHNRDKISFDTFRYIPNMMVCNTVTNFNQPAAATAVHTRCTIFHFSSSYIMFLLRAAVNSGSPSSRLSPGR